jgi:hypothetical protein
MKTKDFDALGKQLLLELPGFTVDIRLCLVTFRRKMAEFGTTRLCARMKL